MVEKVAIFMKSETLSKPYKNRDYFFDNLRLLLIFCVVFCHCLEKVRDSSGSIALMHEVLLCFVMPMFVFVTGYFAKGLADSNSPKRLKILNILVLLIICQIIKMDIYDFGTILKPHYGNWFLLAIAVWYYILPTVNKIKPFLAILIAMIVAVFISGDPEVYELLQLLRIFGFFPFFILGFYCNGDIIERLKANRMRVIEGCVLIVGILLYVFIFQHYVPVELLHCKVSYGAMGLSFIKGGILRLWWYGFALFMGFGVLAVVPRKKYFFTVYGTRTLPIYIIHTILWCFIAVYTDFFDQVANYDNTAIIFFVFSILVTIVCGNKWFNNWFNQFMNIKFEFLFKEKHIN